MTPKEKAQDLIFNFMSSESEKDLYDMVDIKDPLIFANLAVDQIIDEIVEIDSQMSESGLLYKNLKYWKEVKKEIENYDT